MLNHVNLFSLIVYTVFVRKEIYTFTDCFLFLFLFFNVKIVE